MVELVNGINGLFLQLDVHLIRPK